MVDRRTHSRVPLRILLMTVLVVAGLWLIQLYQEPTWAKIGSFVVGYFLGSFVMQWVQERGSRVRLSRPLAPPAVTASEP